MDTKNLSPKEIESLNRITTVGAQKAALVLTKMTGINIDVSFPEMSVMDVENFFQSEEKENRIVGFVFCRFSGEVDGFAGLLLSEESVLKVLKSFYGKEVPSIDQMDDIDYSGVKEVGNIIIASFLNALSNTYGITAMPTVPDVAIDYSTSIFQEFSLMLLNENKDNLVSFKTQLITQRGEKAIFATLLILFDPDQTIPGILR